MSATEGVRTRHARKCRTRAGGRCSCSPSYQVNLVDARSGQRVWKTCATLAEAKAWRQDAASALRGGRMAPPTRTTVAQAAGALLDGMKAGTILSRSERRYKPATIRSYERALTARILPRVGPLALTEVTRGTVKALVRGLIADGLDPSTVRNTLDPLRVIFREAVEDEVIAVDPTDGLRLPQGRGRRDRVADRGEAEALLGALPTEDRALWACAFYAGLRRGELQALRWVDLDLDAEPAVLRVTRSYDDEGRTFTTPKSDAGARTVPVVGRLRRLLVAHKLATGRRDDALVFGRSALHPFTPSTVARRAREAWTAANDAEAERLGRELTDGEGLRPITLHEARHSTASYLVDAGANDLELAAVIGHSDPRTTKTIYAHLFADSCARVGTKLDAYLDAAEA